MIGGSCLLAWAQRESRPANTSPPQECSPHLCGCCQGRRVRAQHGLFSAKGRHSAHVGDCFPRNGACPPICPAGLGLRGSAMHGAVRLGWERCWRACAVGEEGHGCSSGECPDAGCPAVPSAPSPHLQLCGEDAAHAAGDDEGGDSGQHHQAQVPAADEGHNLQTRGDCWQREMVCRQGSRPNSTADMLRARVGDAALQASRGSARLTMPPTKQARPCTKLPSLSEMASCKAAAHQVVSRLAQEGGCSRTAVHATSTTLPSNALRRRAW